MSMNLAYDLATATDEDTKEILENTILLLIPSSNPDGIDIVADWYRKTLGTKYEGTSPPELYHHYAGHDNNRDWFMMNLAETRNITKLFWQEWFPQIVYDVHQQGQTASSFITPPFFDPPNPRIDPLILREVGLLGYKMAADLQSSKYRRRCDQFDLRHLVARRFSFRALLSQFDRHFVRSRKCGFDVADHRYKRAVAEKSRRTRFDFDA